VVNDIKELIGSDFVTADPPNTTPNELVELTVTPVGPKGNDNGNWREVIALSQHTELDEAHKIARVEFKPTAEPRDFSLAHGVM